MIWKPHTIEKRQGTEVAFEVTQDLYDYLVRISVTSLASDPPWLSAEFGEKPTLVESVLRFGYQTVEVGDWLILVPGVPRIHVMSRVAFERSYRMVTA